MTAYRLAAVLLVLAFVLLPAALVAAQEAWERVAAHPQASQQPTDYGRMIRTLHEWDGLLYPGYGDYGANTGPVRITPFDPSTDAFRSSIHTADTEQIHLYREIGGRLRAPHIDPGGGADYSVGEPWDNRNVVSSLHVYDVVEAAGSVWMAGSSGRNATVWRSTNGGSSWSVSLQQQLGSDDWARFYFAGVHNGKVYVQADGFHGRATASKVWNGSSWVTGPDLQVNGYGQSPRPFNGEMVYLGLHPGGCSSLAAFDGSSARRLVSAYDYVIDGGHLYALRCDGTVERTADLSSWQAVTPPLDVARSLAVVDDRVYAGGSDGRIYRVSLAEPQDPPPSDEGGGRLCVFDICLLG